VARGLRWKSTLDQAPLGRGGRISTGGLWVPNVARVNFSELAWAKSAGQKGVSGVPNHSGRRRVTSRRPMGKVRELRGGRATIASVAAEVGIPAGSVRTALAGAPAPVEPTEGTGAGAPARPGPRREERALARAGLLQGAPLVTCRRRQPGPGRAGPLRHPAGAGAHRLVGAAEEVLGLPRAASVLAALAAVGVCAPSDGYEHARVEDHRVARRGITPWCSTRDVPSERTSGWRMASPREMVAGPRSSIPPEVPAFCTPPCSGPTRDHRST